MTIINTVKLLTMIGPNKCLVFRARECPLFRGFSVDVDPIS